MNFALTPDQQAIRESIERICSKYSLNYWAECDSEEKFPEAFFRDMVDNGWLAITIPEAYGGVGLGITEATIVMQTIAESGAAMNGVATVHSYVFAPNPIVVHGTEEQKRRMLVPLCSGKERACFALTEPNTGLDMTRLKSRAVRKGDTYFLTGEKVWPTAASRSDRLMIIARTTPIEECDKPVNGLSLFYTPIDRRYVKTQKIPKMGRNAISSDQVFLDGLPVPIEDRIGEEGKGFYYLLDGINPERILVAAEGIGIGRAALFKAAKYAKERIVFGRPIGMNQAVQHPLAESWMELEAANLMVFKAAHLYDSKLPCAAEANAAKYLAGEAGFKACTRAVMAHGGYGYAKEYHVERLLRESLIPRMTPVSPELILCYIAERVLGLPKSY